eukprot:6398658-Pyramimonas_sp.AAC.1
MGAYGSGARRVTLDALRSAKMPFDSFPSDRPPSLTAFYLRASFPVAVRECRIKALRCLQQITHIYIYIHPLERVFIIRSASNTPGRPP